LRRYKWNIKYLSAAKKKKKKRKEKKKKEKLALFSYIWLANCICFDRVVFVAIGVGGHVGAKIKGMNCHLPTAPCDYLPTVTFMFLVTGRDVISKCATL
jgi:hypothetical protein